MSRVAPFAIGGLSAALGLFHLGTDELSTDEATSFFIARRDWGDTWISLSTSEANGSPFYLLLHFWTSLGDTEFVLRILPLIFAVATPVVLYLLVSRLFGPAYGVGAGLLLAVNAFFVFQSQNLRSYSLSAFLATLATYLFVRLVEDRPPWVVPAYVVTGALLIYSHFFGAWVLVVHVMSLVLLDRRGASLRPLLVSYGSIALLATPLAFFVLFQDVGQVDWIPVLSTKMVITNLRELTGFNSTQMVAFMVLFLAAAAVAVARFRKERRSREAWATALVVLWFFVPVTGALAISFVKPLWQSRYLLVALPGLVVCAVVALGALRRPIFTVVGFFLLLGLSAWQLPDMYGRTYELDWQTRASVIQREGTLDDGLIFYAPTTIRTFGYHYGFYKRDMTHPEIIYPDKYWLGFSRTRFNIPLDSILDKAGDHDRIWMMLGAAKAKERKVEQVSLIDGLARTCGTVDRTWRRMGILLFEGCRGTG